jgi:hypothetical protein
MEFFSNLDPFIKVFWFVAVPTSVIFLIQTVMTFAGVDSHDGVTADFDADLNHGDTPFQLFTFRNLINFLLGFSWTGISFYGTIDSKGIVIALSFIIGAAFVAAFFGIMNQIQKLAEDNSFKIDNALNQVGSVYLAIPERKSGKGKVQVSVKGAFHELDAITENDKIESSAMVRIVRIESNNLVVVERI